MDFLIERILGVYKICIFKMATKMVDLYSVQHILLPTVHSIYCKSTVYLCSGPLRNVLNLAHLHINYWKCSLKWQNYFSNMHIIVSIVTKLVFRQTAGTPVATLMVVSFCYYPVNTGSVTSWWCYMYCNISRYTVNFVWKTYIRLHWRSSVVTKNIVTPWNPRFKHRLIGLNVPWYTPKVRILSPITHFI